IVDETGLVQASASVSGFEMPAKTLATIYEDREGQEPKANPFLSDADGFARFYSTEGRYRIRARKEGMQRIYDDVLLDGRGGSGGAGGGGGGEGEQNEGPIN